MRQTVTIEAEVPDGYEAVAFRMPVEGERFVSDEGEVIHTRHSVCWPRLIVRKAHVWPEWLPDGWVAVDSNGEVWWYENKPTLGARGDEWNSGSGESNRLSKFFPVPAYTIDWKRACWQVSQTK